MRKSGTLWAALTVAMALLGASGVAAAAGYDVSYLWHGQLPSVEKYRDRVAGVLGPEVARRLRIVQKPGLYGLIYYRNGSADGARKAAAVHTRLLRARGLEAAAPTRSLRWNYVGQGVAPASQPVQVASARPAIARIESADPSPTSVATAPAAVNTDGEGRRDGRISGLEQAVENYIKRLRASGAIARDERTAWSVYDFTTGEKLVTINEDVQFQAASMVKPFFAMAFFHQVDQGKLVYGPESRKHMRRMIQYSNNYSTNWVLRQVGGPAAVQTILTRYYGNVFQDVHIVEYIPSGGRTYRNKASAHDYSRFLYSLWREELPGSAEIKRLMSLPAGNRLYTGASSVPPGTELLNKTGSTARLCGDMGILVVKDRQGRRYPYTLIGVIEKNGRARNYTSWIRSRGNVIREVSNIVYEEISRQHNLRS